MLALSETIRAAFAHDAEGGRGGLARSPMAETAKAVDPCVARTRCISICNDRSPDEAGKYAVAEERRKLGRKMGSNDSGHGRLGSKVRRIGCGGSRRPRHQRPWTFPLANFGGLHPPKSADFWRLHFMG